MSALVTFSITLFQSGSQDLATVQQLAVGIALQCQRPPFSRLENSVKRCALESQIGGSRSPEGLQCCRRCPWDTQHREVSPQLVLRLRLSQPRENLMALNSSRQRHAVHRGEAAVTILSTAAGSRHQGALGPVFP